MSTITNNLLSHIERGRGGEKRAVTDVYCHLVSANYARFEGRGGIESGKRARRFYKLERSQMFDGMARLSGGRNASAMLWENALGVEGYLSPPQRAELRDLLERLVEEGVLPDPKGSFAERWSSRSREASRAPAQGAHRPEVASRERRSNPKRGGPIPVESQHVDWAEIRRTHEQPSRAWRRESRLVLLYRDFLAAQGIDVSAYEISRSAGEPLRADLWIPSGSVLVEAKAGVRRADVRMALGQLADYAHAMDVKPKLLAILLPERPADDLVGLLASERVELIYRTETGFDHSRGLARAVLTPARKARTERR